MDLGNGFRAGRLDGAVEERRDAVPAALRRARCENGSRLGDRGTVLAAL